MRPHGKISLTAMILIATFIAGLYALVVFAPIIGDNFNVQEAVAIAFNQAGKYSDDELRNIIREKLVMVGTHLEDDGFGNLQEKMGLALTNEQIVIDRNEPAGTIRIQVDYSRDAEFKLIKRVVPVSFHPSKEGPIVR